MHDGITQTAAPSPLTNWQYPVGVNPFGTPIASVGWVEQRSSDPTSFAAADAGATLSHNSSGGVLGGLQKDTPSGFPANLSYYQGLWMLPLWDIRHVASDPQPDADLDPGEDPLRWAGWVWESGIPSLASVRWLPFDQNPFNAFGIGSASRIEIGIQTTDGTNLTTTDISNACAHGFTLNYYDASQVVDTTTYRGYITDAYTTSSHWVPSGSLPAGGFTVHPSPSDFTFSAGQQRLTCILEFDVLAGDGVNIPINDYLTLDTAYVLASTEWQATETSPGTTDLLWYAAPQYTLPIQNLIPVSIIYAEYETGTFHFTYYDGPGGVDPVTLALDLYNNVGTIDYHPAVSDQDVIRTYDYKLYDITNTTTPVWTSSTFGFDLTGIIPHIQFPLGAVFPGHGYYATVQASDSYGPGPAGISNTVYADEPNLDGAFIDGSAYFGRGPAG